MKLTDLLNSRFSIGVAVAGAIITAACQVASTVDGIKNGDRRAVLTGEAAGREVANATAERYNRTIFGTMVEVDDQKK